MKKIILVIFSVALLVSCKKTIGPEGPQGPQGPDSPNGNGTGIIMGSVHQFDSYEPHTRYTTGLNTVTVSIDGTSLTTVTDDSGNYTFTKLPVGQYSFSFSKPGAGLSKKQDIVFPGAGTMYVTTDSIYDLPAYTFSSGFMKDTILQTNQHYLLFSVYCEASLKFRDLIVVFGKTNSVNLSDPDSYDQTYTIKFKAPSGYFIIYNMAYPISFVGNYPTGTQFYAKIYPISSLKSDYFDKQKNKRIYTTYGIPLPTTFTLTLP